jgi:nitrite reductase/ring-hydroxylating ferredoxin subunit
MSIAVKVATLGDLPENSVSVVEYADQRIALYRVGMSIYATTDICSHEYAELSQGYLDTDDCTIECPLHGSRFDIRTGAVLSLPAYEPIAVYPVRVDGDDVLVELPD